MIRSPRFVRACRAVLGTCLALAVSVTPAAAQDTGTVSGTVVDNSSQVVPGASVTLTNEATGDIRTTTSGDRGVFTFRAVPPGSYTVKIDANFGTAIGIANPTRPPRVLQMSVRFNF